MDQHGLFRSDLGDVMIDDHPVGSVHALFEYKICHPRAFFPQLALLPVIVVVGLQPDLDAKELPRQPLQQHAGDQPVEVAFMGEDHFRSRERFNLADPGPGGEWGMKFECTSGEFHVLFLTKYFFFSRLLCSTIHA